MPHFSSVRGADAGERRIFEDSTAEEGHDVEGGSDYAVVFAETHCFGDGDVGLFHCVDNSIFAVDLVGSAGEEFAGWFLAP